MWGCCFGRGAMGARWRGRSMRVGLGASRFTPFPRRREGAGPKSAFGAGRLLLLGSVSCGVAVGERPTVPHHPGIHIRAVGRKAGREHAFVLVEARRLASEVSPIDVASQLLCRDVPAGPRPSLGIGAGLFEFGRIDSMQANAGAQNSDRVAIDHDRRADDGRKRQRGRMLANINGDRGCQQNEKRDRASTRACVADCVSSDCPSGHVTRQKQGSGIG